MDKDLEQWPPAQMFGPGGRVLEGTGSDYTSVERIPQVVHKDNMNHASLQLDLRPRLKRASSEPGCGPHGIRGAELTRSTGKRQASQLTPVTHLIQLLSSSSVRYPAPKHTYLVTLHGACSLPRPFHVLDVSVAWAGVQLVWILALVPCARARTSKTLLPHRVLVSSPQSLH